MRASLVSLFQTSCFYFSVQTGTETILHLPQLCNVDIHPTAKDTNHLSKIFSPQRRQIVVVNNPDPKRSRPRVSHPFPKAKTTPSRHNLTKGMGIKRQTMMFTEERKKKKSQEKEAFAIVRRKSRPTRVSRKCSECRPTLREATASTPPPPHPAPSTTDYAESSTPRSGAAPRPASR